MCKKASIILNPIKTILLILILVLTSQAQWVQTNGPYSSRRINTLFVSGGNLFAGTESEGIFLSTNNGTSWNAVNTGLENNSVRAFAVIGNNLFAGTGGGVFLSANNGTSWNAVNTGLENNSVWALALNGGNLFAGTYSGGVFLSTDTGKSWNPANNGLLEKAYAFAAKGDNLFAGTPNSGVFLTTNNGTSWTAVNNGLTDLHVQSFAVKGDYLFTGAISGVFLSTNNGASWIEVNEGLTRDDRTITSFAVSGSNLFACAMNFMSGRVYLSTNNGALWSGINTGLTDSLVFALAVNDSFIFAGNFDTGMVWRRPLSDFPTSIRPNPKNNPLQTKIRVGSLYSMHSGITLTYSIQSHCFVRLGIYTISGKRAALLEDGYRSPGVYNVRLDPVNVPKGLYICRFRAGRYRECRRIMVIDE